MTQLSVPIWEWSPDAWKMTSIRLLLSWGFNDQEIAEKTGLHRVTVGRYRKILRAAYDESIDKKMVEQTFKG